MDLVVKKALSDLASGAQANPDSPVAKGGASKFDKVLEESKPATKEPPSKGVESPASLQRSPVAELQQKIGVSPMGKPADIFAHDLKTTGTNLNQLTQRVRALPETSTFDSIRNQLAALDAKYQQIGTAVGKIPDSANLPQLLKLQKDMYDISENIGLVSKLVDQLTSGVKSLLQTQI